MRAAELAIETLPKGALPDPPDSRDFQAAAVLGSFVVDWSKPFSLPEPPDADQGISDSCVAHAFSYYHWQLTGKDYSRRDLFSRIALVYGAYIRDGALELVKRGQLDHLEAPDPQNWRPPQQQNPSNMRKRDDIDERLGYDDIQASAFSLPVYNINAVAYAIDHYKGCVFGVQGDNEGWRDMLNPKPPRRADWGHAIYAFDYHMHGGQKCIIAKSSWCSTGIKQHHIKEDYFRGDTFSPWVVIPKEKLPMNQSKLVLGKDGKTVFICTPVPDIGMDGLKKLTNVWGIPVPNPIPPSKDL